MKTGDAVIWSNGWHSIIEWFYVQGIKLVAGEPTHVSTVVVIDGQVYLWESYAHGQCLHLLDSRIATAANEHWKYWQWLPLNSELRKQFDEKAAIDYCLAKLGTAYSVIGGIRAGFRIPIDSKNDKKLFCSASHVFALQAGGLFLGENANSYTPKDVVNLMTNGKTND